MRLALVLAASVAVLLLVAGVAVNLIVTRSVEDLVGEERVVRLELAADALVELHRERGTLQIGDRLVHRLARSIGGSIEIRDASGTVVARGGNPPPRFAAQERLEVTLTDDSVVIGSLTAIVPARGAEQPFLRVFNVTLLSAGLLTVAGILGVSAVVSRRLTRPLSDVAESAQRLGAGDLSVRARGGDDAESRELARAFNEMAARLERSEELRRRAATDMAHELATPVTVLESQLQAMIDGVVPADAEQLDRARLAAAAVGAVVVELGDLASAEAAAAQRAARRVDVAAVVDDAAESVRALYRSRGVTLSISRAGAPLFVVADPQQLQRALRNVLANAAQYSAEGTMVRIELGAESADAIVRVHDQGPGIASDDLPYIFERFYRADRARARGGGGTGIGLTIARELIRANGGRIEVEKTGPDGTTFLIGIPLA